MAKVRGTSGSKAGLMGAPIAGQPARAGYLPRSVPLGGRTDVKPYSESWNQIPSVHSHVGSLSLKKTPSRRRRS